MTRLIEMGVEPFLTGSAVSAVLAQRLARKLCPHCCEMYMPSVEELIEARLSPEVAAATDGMVMYRKRGCPRCGQCGYRAGWDLPDDGDERKPCGAGDPEGERDEVEREAMASGTRTLWDDGMAKVPRV